MNIISVYFMNQQSEGKIFYNGPQQTVQTGTMDFSVFTVLEAPCRDTLPCTKGLHGVS